MTPLTIQGWPQTLGSLIPQTLQSLDFPCRFTLTYAPLSASSARTLIDDLENKWGSAPMKLSELTQAAKRSGPKDAEGNAPKDNLTQTYIQSMKRARVSLDNGELAYGYTTATVLVWAPTHATLRSRVAQVQTLLHARGVTLMPETVGAVRAWQATLPGHIYPTPRTRPTPSMAPVLLFPHTQVYPGPARDEHMQAPCLMTVQSDGSPLRIPLHPPGSEVGAAAILGGTRTGKDALAGFMMSQFWRYAEAQIFCFDKDFSQYCTTLLHGGTHINLCDPDATTVQSLQPLAAIDDEAERRWALTWLEGIPAAKGLAPTPDEVHRYVADALSSRHTA